VTVPDPEDGRPETTIVLDAGVETSTRGLQICTAVDDGEANSRNASIV